MPNHSSITFCIEGEEENRTLGNAFGQHFIDPLISQRHVGVSMMGEKDIGKSTFFYGLLKKFFQEKEMGPIYYKNVIEKKGRRFRWKDMGMSGAYLNMMDFPKAQHGYLVPPPSGRKALEKEPFGSGECLPGLDCVEHPTLPNLSRCDVMVTLMGEDNSVYLSKLQALVSYAGYLFQCWPKMVKNKGYKRTAFDILDSRAKTLEKLQKNKDTSLSDKRLVDITLVRREPAAQKAFTSFKKETASQFQTLSLGASTPQ